jgi:fructose-bisphosphate aldolase class II
MTVVSTRSLVDTAVGTGRAVLAFNAINLETAEALASAAEQTGSALIMQISQNAVRYHGGQLAPLATACRAIAAASRANLSLHLDHVQDTELLRQAPEWFSSVMVDASRLDYDANVSVTAQAAQWAHGHGLWVEAELGEVGGKDGAHAPGARTDPAQAAEFVAATGVDALAVAVGSSHAMTERVARLDLNLVTRLQRSVSVPLVLHGSSGVPAAQLRQAVSNGIVKINIGTLLAAQFTQGAREELARSDRVDPRVFLSAARDAMVGAAASCLRDIEGTSTG